MLQKNNITKKNTPDSSLYKILQDKVNSFTALNNLTPPLTMEELNNFTKQIIKENPELQSFRDWLLVMLNNSVWLEVVASVPFNRRILLLPQCLKNSDKCQAPIDEFGLLCQGCGNCELASLQDEADKLKTMCLIAEGSAIVADLLESGSVDAVIGVGCLDALEKSFPYMVKHAIPGIAIPLFDEGCKDTTTDFTLIKSIIRSKNSKNYTQLPVQKILQEVRSWFNEKELTKIMGSASTKTDTIARNWLNINGRRFRPFLATATALCLKTKNFQEDKNLKKLSLSVECFHKASLIHDDIEDNDTERYGQPALHEKWGIPIALNIGDLLLGEGYRLISEMDIADSLRSRLLNIAASRHLTLCRGQGEEFLSEQNGNCSVEKVLEIFRQKTSPAFEVALTFGLIYGESDEKSYPVIHQFSSKLGIAFQILDDLNDFDLSEESKNKTSIIKTLRETNGLSLKDARQKTLAMYKDYRSQTLQTLKPLENYPLKCLLFQITMRILQDVQEL